jgi:hypothetical protein
LKVPNGDFKMIEGSTDVNRVVDIINTSIKPNPFPLADMVGPNATVVQNRSFVGGSNSRYSIRQVFSFEEYNNEVALREGTPTHSSSEVPGEVGIHGCMDPVCALQVLWV